MLYEVITIPVKIRKERKLFGGGGKITPMDIAVFSRQLATMLTAGMSSDINSGIV